jgi:hypothetical protein
MYVRYRTCYEDDRGKLKRNFKTDRLQGLAIPLESLTEIVGCPRCIATISRQCPIHPTGRARTSMISDER